MTAAWKLFTARRIHTGAGEPVQAVATLGERVVAVGTADELRQRFPCDEQIDLAGVLLPGFNDAHAHPAMAAENLLHLDVSPDVVTDRSALTRQLREHSAGLAPGEWLIASRYDHTKTTGGQIVDRAFLDEVVGDRPAILMHVAVHWAVVNSAGLALRGLDDSSRPPDGGAYGRDAAGHLNGIVYEQALFDIAYPSLARDESVLPTSPLESRLSSLVRLQSRMHAAGITSVCDALCGPDDVRLYREARRRGLLTLRVGMLVAFRSYDRLAALGIGSGFGDEHLRIAGVKGFVDGACAGGNCLVVDPFEGTSDHGMQVMSTAELNALVARCVRDDVALAVHANGDRAIDLLLRAHEAVDPPAHARARHRIEHGTLLDPGLIARIRRLGLVVVPFGSYARFHGDKLPGYFGERRLERMFAHKDLLRAGIPVAGSSDYPCAPFEPLAGIASCVLRRSLDGSEVGASQRIGVESAVDLYTSGSAYATGEEHLKGRLAPGMLADFVELAEDPLEVTEEHLADIVVSSTWVGAARVHPA